MDSYYVALQNEDRKLRIGKEVVANWTANGFSYKGRGKVVKLGSGRVTVELLAPAGQWGEFLAGDRIQVPRPANISMWSQDNCVRPAEKKAFRHKDLL